MTSFLIKVPRKSPIPLKDMGLCIPPSTWVGPSTSVLANSQVRHSSPNLLVPSLVFSTRLKPPRALPPSCASHVFSAAAATPIVTCALSVFRAPRLKAASILHHSFSSAYCSGLSRRLTSTTQHAAFGIVASLKGGEKRLVCFQSSIPRGFAHCAAAFFPRYSPSLNSRTEHYAP